LKRKIFSLLNPDVRALVHEAVAAVPILSQNEFNQLPTTLFI
jgi:hypothetical protein